MGVENSDQQAEVDLRWPKLSEGLIEGFGALSVISVLSILLHSLYPQANGNSWLVVTPAEGGLSFLKSLVSIFTTHFFHASDEHLWGNLLYLWPVGLIAFAVAGAPRAFGAIGLGICYGGMAQLIFGTNGTIYLGSSSIIFALIGLIILASVRKGRIVTLAMLLGLGFLGDRFFDTIRPTEITAIAGISWLGHLGGLIGGFTADLKSPIEAVRVLHRSSTITDEETEDLLKRAYPEGYSYKIFEELEKETVEQEEGNKNDRAESR